MSLILRAVSLNDQPLTQPITAHFDERGGTIGRADHNTMALPDPERHISREQAEIIATPQGYLIRNVGSSNPIVVRDHSLVHGETAPLAHADKVRIGRYLLEVMDDARHRDGDPTRAPGGETTATERRPRVAALAGAEAAAPLSPDNPFADLFGTPAAQPRAVATAAADADAVMVRLPDDFDPFAPPAPAAQPAVRAAPAGAFDDIVPSSASRSIDELFGLDSRSGGDALAGFLADVKPAAQTAHAAASTDPLVLFGAAAPVTPPPEVLPDRASDVHAAFAPPRPAAAQPRAVDETGITIASAPAMAVARTAPATTVARPAPAPAASTPAAAAAALPAARTDADPASLWRAFCEGAGVKVDLPQGLQPELMRIVGTLLRSSVDGTLQLMAVRSATRHELHAQVTMIQARNNNPLKFSPDGQAALEQLLQPPLRGFLPGPAAVTEAMDDLVGHAIGSMAGTRSALEGVLARFAPQPLEEKLVSTNVIDSVLPMARKAKLWDLYLQHYEGIRDEAQEDFHALFGKAFLAAYEQQLDQLRSERQRARAAT